jgi:glycosyltransferase involved in cell wall biosynthesis
MLQGSPSELLSVIVPVYNGERFLREALASIRAQDHQPMEIIVVDDASTDGTPALLDGLGCQVTAVRLPLNQGPAAARNAGLARARGSMIGFLDVDDLWPAGRLRPMLDVLRADPACALVKGHVCLTRARTRAEVETSLSSPILGPWIGSALYRRSVFDDVGVFDPSLRYAEDLDWFFRAREHGARLRIIEHTTLYVRRHAGNMTRGLDCHDLNVFRALKSSLDRRRTAGPNVAAPLQRPANNQLAEPGALLRP